MTITAIKDDPATIHTAQIPLADISHRQEHSSQHDSTDSSSEWIDDGTVTRSKNTKTKKTSSSIQDASQQSNDYTKRRPKRLSKFRRDADFLRYDRPDMFVNLMFPYMGAHLAPVPTDSSTTPNTIPAVRLPNPRCKVVRLSVENGVMATGAELFESLQTQILASTECSKLPETMDIKGQSLSLEYTPPHGDELVFGPHSQDSAWIGTVLIGPKRDSQAPDDAVSHWHDWEKDWSYRSWHRPLPQGVLEPVPSLHSVATNHGLQKQS